MSIDRPAGEVYDYAADPAHLPEWAAGLAGGIEHVEGAWFAESPMGRVRVAFAERNPFGVLDHDVTLPDGQVVTNPVRVLADGDASEVVFTLRRREQMSEADIERDARAVLEDLARLKRVLESRGAGA